MTKVFTPMLFALLLVFGSHQVAFAQANTNALTGTDSVKAQMDAAIHQVEKIVNQPVTAFRQTSQMRVSVYKEGWFHPGAMKPNFDTVDVRATQETPYAKYQYVSSDLNPGIVFIGSQLEFNAMTKYFYTNHNLPKKKLTKAEMEEINRLYRIIGRCEHQLVPRVAPAAESAPDSSPNAGDSAATPPTRSVFLNPWIGGGLIVGLVLVVFFNKLMRA